MPGKKEQVALQKEITNQEQWEDLMATEGVIVVDVYQKWCGPCNAVVSLFRRMRNETGDDLLKLAVAEADSIDALEKYRGKCEPCFLFFAGGQLVHVIRGASGPALVKGILDQLAAEHRVLDEGAERQVIIDPLLAEEAEKERAKSRAEEEEKKKEEEEAMTLYVDAYGRHHTKNLSNEPVPKEVTVVLIKPDAVQAGKKDEILEKLTEHEFEILAQEERTLTEDEAREFYKEQEGEEHFEELVKFMASGPSHVLVLTKGDTGEGVVHEVRNLLGPKDINIAKEEAPESWRAVYGTDTTMNALHGADSAERAARELTFFFPDFVVPIIPGTAPPPKVEKTLALIRPEALKEHRDAILEKIQEAGFEVCLQKEVQLTEEQAKIFYKEHEGQPFYEDLITEMTKGPVLALGLAKEEAVQGWRDLLGPKEVHQAKEEQPESLRAQFSMTDTTINAIHGSDSTESAHKELEFFFPREHTVAVIKPDAATEHKDAIVERLQEAGFQITCEKHVELSREMAGQLYQEHEGKEFYDSLLDHMTSGPSTVLLLHREDAIHGLRALMGPADPEVAREQAPESFRALLGKDILANAIHGSSNSEHVLKKVEGLFPEVEVTEDGEIIVPSAQEEEAEEGETAEETKQEEAAEGAEAGDEAEDEDEREKDADGEGDDSKDEMAYEDDFAEESDGDGQEDSSPRDVEGESGEKDAETMVESGGDTGGVKDETGDMTGDDNSGEIKQEGEDVPPSQEASPKEEAGLNEDSDGLARVGETEESEGKGESEQKAEETPAPAKGEATSEEKPEENGEKKEEGGADGEPEKEQETEKMEEASPEGGDGDEKKDKTPPEGQAEPEDGDKAEESAPADGGTEEASSEDKKEENADEGASEEKPVDAPGESEDAPAETEGDAPPEAPADAPAEASADAPSETPADTPEGKGTDAPEAASDAPAEGNTVAPASEEEKKEESAPVEQAPE
ncbi:Thioredoxin domain-containing protein 3-like [Holothuria leucospilota]|uniref:Thioredoxin domain-containing protein 3-like n=1 Tax=Holothuria leucospilota TaxID=206669 RepID=A0A9Q0YE21_HOLLE|nr:Thioredoxin domain-containing protein 3-like [Holothuria leucospilota]